MQSLYNSKALVRIAIAALLIYAGNRAECSENPPSPIAAEESITRRLALSAAMPLFYSSPAGGFLQALRTEQFDEPFQPAWMARKQLSAFLVTDTGIEYSSAGRPIVHTSTGRRELLVLVDSASKKAYPLRGLGDCSNSFNGLTKDLHITVQSADQALDLFWIFADIGGGFLERVVLNWRAAQWQVEGYILRRTGGEGLDEVRDSWVKQNARSLQQVAAPRINSVKGGYELVFFVADGGSIHRQRVMIDQLGGIRNLEDTLVTTSIGQKSVSGKWQ
jgi:hypothetical protein